LTLNGFHISLSTMALTSTPSIDQLKRAIAIQEKIAVLQADLAAILGQSGGAAVPARRGRKPKAVVEGAEEASETPVKRKKKRTMSPEAREKIAAAQRKRWAKQKKA
jgi:hypothetical protein